MQRLGLLLLALIAHGAMAAEPGARQTVERFYQGYLGFAGTAANRQLALGYSESMRELLAENARICERAADGPCGWGADGDPYLDSQESQPDLSFESSGFRALESSAGEVTVSFNVYPSQTDAVDFYQKTFTYRLVLEGDQWVVDDIVYPTGSSARAIIKQENQDVGDARQGAEPPIQR